MDTEKMKTIRSRAISALIKVAVIVGWLFWKEHPIFKNLIITIHLFLWAMVPFFCIVFGGLLAATKHLEGLTTKPNIVASAAEMYRVHRSWAWKSWIKYVEAPFILFIGIALEDWSLLVLQTLVVMLSIMVITSGSNLYRLMPAGLKGPDLDGDGVPDAQQRLEQDRQGPIQRLAAKVLGRIYPEENAPGYFRWVIYLPSSFKKYGDDVGIGGVILSATKAKACVEALLLIYGVTESEKTVAQIITDALLEDLDIDYSL